MTKIEKYTAFAIKAVRAAFDAGRQQGVAEERARLLAALKASDQLGERVPYGYGSAVATVRAALHNSATPSSTREIAKLVGTAFAESKVHAVLKGMVRTGEVMRSSRGRFVLASSNPAANGAGKGSPAMSPLPLKR